MPDQITNFYNKKDNKALITGATGFVGLALIEKLLRCFPSMTIFLLIRSKYKKDAATRWEDLKKHAVMIEKASIASFLFYRSSSSSVITRFSQDSAKRKMKVFFKM